jgi:hypothetical protein
LINVVFRRSTDSFTSKGGEVEAALDRLEHSKATAQIPSDHGKVLARRHASSADPELAEVAKKSAGMGGEVATQHKHVADSAEPPYFVRV